MWIGFGGGLVKGIVLVFAVDYWYHHLLLLQYILIVFRAQFVFVANVSELVNSAIVCTSIFPQFLQKEVEEGTMWSRGRGGERVEAEAGTRRIRTSCRCCQRTYKRAPDSAIA